MDHYLKKDEGIFDFIQEGSLDGLWCWDLEKPEFVSFVWLVNVKRKKLNPGRKNAQEKK